MINLVLLVLLCALSAWLFHSLRQHRTRALTDYLTGCANRGHVFERGFSLCDSATKKNQPLAVVLLDIDHFKTINDTLGQGAGDKAIREIVRVVEATLSRGELLGRMGGEEFVVILPFCDKDDAMTRAEEIRQAVAAAGFLHAGEHPVNFTVSLGVACLDAGTDFQTLVNRADEALYVAKNSGRNRVVMASSTAERLSAGAGIVGSRQKTR